MRTLATEVGDPPNLPSPPNECPVCFKTALFAQVGKAHRVPDKAIHSRLQAIFLCPALSCQTLFVVEYRFQGGAVRPLRTFPKIPRPYEVTEGITALSPDFVEIVSQAQEADALNLDQIAGIGFRKALEFLIKDYCISKNPSEADRIRAIMLGPCINEFVKDPKILACAKRAVWLGNDEAHYVRKWSDHDITDLKNLIKLTMHWITHELLTDKYLSEMP